MDRNIFQFNDGKQDRTADPVRIDRLMAYHSGGNLHGLVDLAKSDNPAQAFPATDKLLDVCRKSFGIAAFEEGGPNEDYPLTVFYDFLGFKEKKNLTPASTQTSPAPIPATSIPSPTATLPSSMACG